MSFNFSGPNFRPMIQEAQSMQNNGGGGNTGYFQRGRKKKEEEGIDVFNTEDSEDVFISSEEEEEISENEGGVFDKLVKKVKDKITPQKQGNKPEFGKYTNGDDVDLTI